MAEKITERPKPAQKPPHRIAPPRPDPEITPQTIKGNYPTKTATKEASR